MVYYKIFTYACKHTFQNFPWLTADWAKSKMQFPSYLDATGTITMTEKGPNTITEKLTTHHAGFSWGWLKSAMCDLAQTRNTVVPAIIRISFPILNLTVIYTVHTVLHDVYRGAVTDRPYLQQYGLGIPDIPDIPDPRPVFAHTAAALGAYFNGMYNSWMEEPEP